MKSTKPLPQSEFGYPHTMTRMIHMRSQRLFLRFAAILIFTGMLIAAFDSSSSASRSKKPNNNEPSVARVDNAATRNKASSRIAGPATRKSVEPIMSLLPQGPGETVETFASNCTTPQTVFNVGDTVCVKVSGVPLSAFFPRRVTWECPNSTIPQSTDIATDPQTGSLQITSTFTVGNQVVDSRGAWRVVVRNPFFFFPEAAASFTVVDPANAAADLGVTYTFVSDSVQTGSQATFALLVNNYGPNIAANVQLTNTGSAGTTFVSLQQLGGPSFTCNNGICSIASMNAGDAATFLATYQVDSGPEITNTTILSSATTDTNSPNDSMSVTKEVTAGGGSQCTLTCPANLTFSNDPGTGGHVIAAANFPQATTSGTCGTVSYSVTPNPQTNDYFFGIGTSFITASTPEGDECTFTITVNDVENPTISCPADITVFESSPSSDSAIVNFTVGTTDNSGSATVDCGAHPSGSSFPVGTTQVTCTATDGSGNSSESCSFNVTVNEVNSTCVLTNPGPIVANSNANACGTNVTYTTPTSDGSGTCGTITCDHASGSFFAVGETLVTCTSSPDGGSTSFTVTVNDTTAPVPNQDPLPTITSACAVTLTVPPTATDNCQGTIGATTDDPRTYDQVGTFTVHWMYTDESGNTTSQNQTVNITGNDTTPPTITAPPDVSVNTGTMSCSVVVDDLTLGTADANDNCSVTVTRSGVPAGNEFPVGTTTITYTATDGSGNTASDTQLVTVVDNSPPTITAPADVTFNTGAGATSCGFTVSDLDAELGTATTNDNCPVTVQRSGVPAGNAFPVGMTTVTYTVTDPSGNTASDTQVVTVVDNTPPVVTAPAAVTLYTGPGATSCSVTVTDLDGTFGTGSATDNCPGVGAVSRSGVPAGGVFPEGMTTLTYSATDAHGNTGTATQLVTVVDNTAPVISCPANITVSNDPGQCSAIVNPGTATATDNCDSTPTIVGTRSDNQPLNASYPVGTTTITWTATDDANNQSSCVQTITVNDTELPTISCPLDIVLEPTCPSGAIATYPAAVVGDNCGVQSQSEVTSPTAGLGSGSVFPIGTTTVTRTVTDIHGNTASCSFTVTVKTALAVVEDLKVRVAALQPPLTGQQVQGLQSKLEAARLAIIAGQTNVACNKLADFINQVQVYINSGKLTSAQGQPLINSAANVRNTLGCTNNPCT